MSPVRAAAAIDRPVMLIHGALDRDTPAAHSRRLYDALRGRKRLILVPDADHNHSLTAAMWREIETWIDDVVRAQAQTPEPRALRAP